MKITRGYEHARTKQSKSELISKNSEIFLLNYHIGVLQSPIDIQSCLKLLYFLMIKGERFVLLPGTKGTFSFRDKRFKGKFCRRHPRS